MMYMFNVDTLIGSLNKYVFTCIPWVITLNVDRGEIYFLDDRWID